MTIRSLRIAIMIAAIAAPSVFAGNVPGTHLDRTLVVVELAGGNDGLNMVVPYADPAYYKARPTIAVPADRVVKLDQALGLNPALESLKNAWNAKELAFVLGVGYPQPNRSHFRSIAIWNTASDSNRYLSTGWISRVFAKDAPPSADLADSIIIGEDHAGPLYGTGMRNVAIDSIKGFVTLAALVGDPGPDATASGPVGYIQGVEAEIRRAAERLRGIEGNLPTLKTEFPDTPFGKQLKLASQLLGAGVEVPVVKLTLRGFDTHGNETAVQDNLLRELADGLSAFRSAMIEEGRWDRIAVMTYSEFGRRVHENGSGGTDHGTAAPMLVMGGLVQGGFFGQEPSLTDLDQGDLKYTTDFRSVYQTIVSGFWGITGADKVESIFGRSFPQLGLFRGGQ
ncbi:MAG TPA: DUF1501 domain-containing protein [Spirochaetia bacterium]|nr:DUF1501 domain-containing protein [Spirochaetia bacterium]